METAYSLNNPVFCNFLFYGALLVLKMMIMPFATVFYRIRNKAFVNPEDLTGSCKGAKPVVNDQDVERVRRCHLNDLENIVPFLLAAFLYVSTMPNPTIALLHFRIFTISRLVHMFVYLMMVPQPARRLTYMVGVIVTFSLILQIFTVAVF